MFPPKVAKYCSSSAKIIVILVAHTVTNAFARWKYVQKEIGALFNVLDELHVTV